MLRQGSGAGSTCTGTTRGPRHHTTGPHTPAKQGAPPCGRKNAPTGPSRREFLTLVGTSLFGVPWPGERFRPLPVPRQAAAGIFPIAQTPFTETNQLDVDALAEEVRFIDRAGAHGFVWPQMASEWQSLTERERLDGAR